jgi:FKBP-type peptidyl-prolyl cis-trans isomerase FklB
MKNKVLPLIILLIISCSVNAQKKPDSHNSPLESEMDSVSYSFGLLVAKNLQLQGIENIEYEAFEQGFYHMIKSKKLKIEPEEANMIVQDHMMNLSAREAAKNLEEGRKFLEKNSENDDVITLSSGLQYKVLETGAGKSPKAGDEVSVHYHGTLIDGTVFDSSVERGDPATFRVNGVIPGWQEALKLMRPGAKWMLYIPPDLAYGERGAGDVIGPNTTLIFEVALLKILD